MSTKHLNRQRKKASFEATSRKIVLYILGVILLLPVLGILFLAAAFDGKTWASVGTIIAFGAIVYLCFAAVRVWFR